MKAITPNQSCEHGDCDGRRAVGLVHCDLPIDGGVVGLYFKDGVAKLQTLREPDGIDHGFYHLALCRRHFDDFVAKYPTDECQCAPEVVRT